MKDLKTTQHGQECWQQLLGKGPLLDLTLRCRLLSVENKDSLERGANNERSHLLSLNDEVVPRKQRTWEIVLRVNLQGEIDV